MKTCFVFGLSALILSCSGNKEMSIQVSNDAPELSIISPIDGTQFNEYELVEFVGRTTDLEDAEVDLDVIWFSSMRTKSHPNPLQHLPNLLYDQQIQPVHTH